MPQDLSHKDLGHPQISETLVTLSGSWSCDWDMCQWRSEDGPVFSGPNSHPPQTSRLKQWAVTKISYLGFPYLRRVVQRSSRNLNLVI